MRNNNHRCNISFSSQKLEGIQEIGIKLQFNKEGEIWYTSLYFPSTINLIDKKKVIRNDDDEISVTEMIKNENNEILSFSTNSIFPIDDVVFESNNSVI